MARKAAGKAEARGGGPHRPPPPDKALRTLGKRVRTLESDLRDLTASGSVRNHQQLERESGEFQKIYARIAVIGDRLDTLDSQEDGREQRLAAAIDTTTQAAKVLERVELGLRPMLIKALHAEEKDRHLAWLRTEADFLAQRGDPSAMPYDAHIRAYHINRSSIRS